MICQALLTLLNKPEEVWISGNKALQDKNEQVRV